MIVKQKMLFRSSLGLGLVVLFGFLSILATNDPNEESQDVNHICTPVDGNFTEFLGANVRGSLLKNLVLTPNADDATVARITVHGDDATAMFSAGWGLEITSAFLLDHCELEIGTRVMTSGIVKNEPGGSVTVQCDCGISIYRGTDIPLGELAHSGLTPLHQIRTFPYGGRVKVDDTPGLHVFEEFEDWAEIKFGETGATITLRNVTSPSLFFPNYALEVGDEILIGCWIDFKLENSAISFELNDVGQTTIGAYLNHKKWR
jgi:hypothetical protein